MRQLISRIRKKCRSWRYQVILNLQNKNTKEKVEKFLGRPTNSQSQTNIPSKLNFIQFLKQKSKINIETKNPQNDRRQVLNKVGSRVSHSVICRWRRTSTSSCLWSTLPSGSNVGRVHNSHPNSKARLCYSGIKKLFLSKVITDMILMCSKRKYSGKCDTL